ncbi:hypothetical protein NQZ68_001302 [Dissostichus eleginoides]|nr:hypothetical protein NQZ68_001302 [Dissostichus eleginoides]
MNEATGSRVSAGEKFENCICRFSGETTELRRPPSDARRVDPLTRTRGLEDRRGSEIQPPLCTQSVAVTPHAMLASQSTQSLQNEPIESLFVACKTSSTITPLPITMAKVCNVPDFTPKLDPTFKCSSIYSMLRVHSALGVEPLDEVITLNTPAINDPALSRNNSLKFNSAILFSVD